MELGGLDLQSLAMIGGFFVAGFVGVWIFMTLRQGENRARNRSEGSNEGD